MTERRPKFPHVDKISPDDSMAIIIIDEDEDGDEGDEDERTIQRRRYPEREQPEAPGR
jgi:hypothetical protein